MKLTKEDFEYLKLNIKYLDLLNKYCGIYKIDTPSRIKCLFANLAWESNNFYIIREKITVGSKGYEGNLNLGNTQKGDGLLFIGRGLPQLTGRWNYTDFNKWLKSNGYNYDVISNPELLVTNDEVCVLSAIYFWSTKKLETYADKDDFVNVCSIWNTGKIVKEEKDKLKINHLSERIAKYKLINNWFKTLVK